MRIILLFFALSFFPAGVISCQTPATITDVDFSLENNLIKVNYSITGALNNELFTISLSFSDESGGTIIPVSVSGDIGANIAPGFNKTILWDVDKDNIEITGVIKAVVKIVPGIVISPQPYPVNQMISGEKPLGGPGYAFLSFVVPSLGGYFVEKNKTRAIVFSLTEATLAIHMINLNNKIKNYETDLDSPLSQTERNEINDKLATAEDNYYKSMVTFGLFWVADVIWVAIKGTQNMNNHKTKGTQYNYYGDGFNLNYSGNQVCVGYRITF